MVRDGRARREATIDTRVVVRGCRHERGVLDNGDMNGGRNAIWQEGEDDMLRNMDGAISMNDAGV